MSSRPTRRSQQTRKRGRARTRGGQAKPNPRQAAIRCDQPRSPTAPARSGPDHANWDRAMIRLRRISLLLGATLLTVIARMIIDGLTLVGGLTGALIGVLLLGSLQLRRQGRRLGPGPPGRPPSG